MSVIGVARSTLRRIERAVRPGRRAWKGAALGLAIGTALLVTILVFHLALRPTPSWGKVLAIGKELGLLAAAALGALGVFWALTSLPARYRTALVFAVALLAPFLGGLGGSPAALVFYLAAWSLTGAGFAVIADGGLRRLSLPRRAITVVGVLLGLAGITTVFVFMADRGEPAIEVRNAALEAQVLPDPLPLPDPSAPGPYTVTELTYGSGEDHRHEFGRDVDLVTEPVDGSPLLDNWDGWSGWARSRFWGVDEETLPLQGRIWAPEGEGPFPLVLIVHGNHGMEDYSDPGYAYLGQLLASRGYLFVSVDENFINSSIGDRLDGGLRQENDARGWLLLEHLRQWREWNEDPDGRFAGRVDLDRIGLIGHSRGGEAVAVAAAFNELPYYPDDATLAFDYGFGIEAVIAIAPVYGQYRPAGLLTPLHDVNYLVIHGANDADVSSFAGSAQFERVEFSGSRYRFKSTVYVYGANHGQFNSVWGATDTGPPFSALLNVEALMPGEQQRQAAKVFIGAFLAATLGDTPGYLPLFEDARRAREWLPETVYLTDFRDSTFRTVADFDEDLDLTTATLAGARIESQGLSRWREDRVGLKWTDKATNAAYVGWQNTPDEPLAEDEAPRYTIRFDSGHDASGARALVLSLADADENPAPDDDSAEDEDDTERIAEEESPANDPPAEDDEKQQQDSDDDSPPEPLDLTLRLSDLDGRFAELPLSRFAPVQPQLEVATSKGIFGDAARSSEVVYQSFVFPLDWFREREAEIDLSRLASIELRFDRTAEGVLVIDDVGFDFSGR